MVQQEINMITSKLIIAIVIIGVLTYLLYDERKRHKIEKKNMSFIESLNLTGLPIVSFLNNDQIVNLVLDTGSNTNLIDEQVLSTLSYKKSELKNTVIGIAGESEESNYILIPLSYKNKTFDTVCIATNMSATISAFKEEYGVTIHGVLGTNFFTKYKYILDFNEMVAYSKLKD